ncbi:MAG: DUF1631 domain-containing protein [Methylophaga sp.]|nr:DUF1631 domain-containing protein [Methylophaga sp.]
MATNNIISFGSSDKMASTKSSFNSKALKSCRPIIANSLPNCFVFLNDLDDILFKLADKAESNQEQEEFFVAMRQFRINQEKLKKDFTQLVLDDFDEFCSSSLAKNKSSAKDSTSSANLELSILDNESLEEDIAVNRIAMKSETLFGHDMANLDQRFANALNIKKVDDNPLNPERIAGHIKDVIAPLSSNIEIKLVAYKQFERHAVSELGKLCAQLNENLIQQGVLPNLEKKKPKIEDAHQATSNIINEMADLDLDDIGDEQSGLVDPSQFFEGLRQFLNKPQGNQPNYGGRSSAPIAEHSTVLSALSGLQQRPKSQVSFDADGSAHLPDIRQILMDSLLVTQQDGTQVQQTVSRLDEDAMDLIDLLFEFILDDQSIPAPIRAVLARLQIPLLKIALSDKDVFSKKSHPARRLLNNLAKSSTGWSEQQSAQQDKLQTKIESIVDTILLEFETDIQLFLDLNTQFNEFISQLNKSSQAAEQRIVQANEGQEKLISAQQDVDNVINQQLSQHDHLPKVVISLIEDGWKHVLKLRLLQKGKDSDEWRTSIELIQQLLWSVSPKPDEDDRKKLLEIIPGMLKSLREGLSGASFNQHKITALFKDLQQCHIQCMNGAAIADDELQDIDKLSLATASKPDLETLPALDEKKKVISDNLAMQKAKQLSVGTWLEIASDDGKAPQRIKFSWRSNLTGRCLFVTYQGTKAAEIAITELASWFQQGKILVIDQSTQLMDRALASMMETVDS